MGIFSTVISDSQREFDRIVTDAMNDGAVLVNSGLVFLDDVTGTAQYTHWAHLVSGDLVDQVSVGL